MPVENPTATNGPPSGLESVSPATKRKDLRHISAPICCLEGNSLLVLCFWVRNSRPYARGPLGSSGDRRSPLQGSRPGVARGVLSWGGGLLAGPAHARTAVRRLPNSPTRPARVMEVHPNLAIAPTWGGSRRTKLRQAVFFLFSVVEVGCIYG